MPELPEVETIRKGLSRRIVGKLIARVEVRKAKIIRGSAVNFARTLADKQFSDVRRHGKLLMLPIENTLPQKTLLIHLKMTGQLIYKDTTHTIAGGHQWPPVRSVPNKYTHVIFTFVDESTLFFNDLRQFGFMELVDEQQLQARLAQMGIDPMKQKLTFEMFLRVVGKRTASIKAILLNQQLIAGIGNIYADEICFAAKIKPQRRANTLTLSEKRAVFQAIPRVLTRALKYGGTTFRDYLDSDGEKGNFTRLLSVYGRAGQHCRRCQRGIIKKIVLAQRGTHFCSACQR